MNCSQAEQFFDAYLDHELSGSMRLEFDAHRLHCTLCQQKLSMMEACEHILTFDDHGPELSTDFTRDLMAQIVDEPVKIERLRRRRIMWALAGVTQVAAAIALFAFWLSFDRQDTASSDGFVSVPSAISLEDAVKDRYDLTGYIYARVTEQFLAAGRTVSDDWQLPLKYALQWKVPEDVGDLSAWSPFGTPSTELPAAEPTSDRRVSF